MKFRRMKGVEEEEKEGKNKVQKERLERLKIELGMESWT